jgi:dihydroneopterin aldolase
MNDTTPAKTMPRPALQLSDAARGVRHVFVRDLRLMASVGTHAHERLQTQPVVINLDLAVRETAPAPSNLADVVCYEAAIDTIKAILGAGHIELVETVAERIAQACLLDSRVESARVRVEKPMAVTEAASVGVEIERSRGK